MIIMGSSLQFSTKTYVVGTHLKCLCKGLQMSTHNMFLWRNEKKNYPIIITKYSSLTIPLPQLSLHLSLRGWADGEGLLSCRMEHVSITSVSVLSFAFFFFFS